MDAGYLTIIMIAASLKYYLIIRHVGKNFIQFTIFYAAFSDNKQLELYC